MENEPTVQSSDQEREKPRRVYSPPILKTEGKVDEITNGLVGSSPPAPD